MNSCAPFTALILVPRSAVTSSTAGLPHWSRGRDSPPLIGGTERRYVTIERTSSCVRYCVLSLTTSAMGPAALARPGAEPVDRYATSSSSLQLPTPLFLSDVMLYACQPACTAPEKRELVFKPCVKLRGVWHSSQCARPWTRYAPRFHSALCFGSGTKRPSSKLNRFQNTISQRRLKGNFRLLLGGA